MAPRTGEDDSDRRVCFLRRWSPREYIVVLGKFRRGWKLRGLSFHLWDDNQLSYILKDWGKVMEVVQDSLKFVDLSKVKLWVEMHPNVVLLALLEVEDEDWSFTIAVSVIREEEGIRLLMIQSTRSRGGLVLAGGSFSLRPRKVEGTRGASRE